MPRGSAKLFIKWYSPHHSLEWCGEFITSNLARCYNRQGRFVYSINATRVEWKQIPVSWENSQCGIQNEILHRFILAYIYIFFFYFGHPLCPNKLLSDTGKYVASGPWMWNVILACLAISPSLLNKQWNTNTGMCIGSLLSWINLFV